MLRFVECIECIECGIGAKLQRDTSSLSTEPKEKPKQRLLAQMTKSCWIRVFRLITRSFEHHQTKHDIVKEVEDKEEVDEAEVEVQEQEMKRREPKMEMRTWNKGLGRYRPSEGP